MCLSVEVDVRVKLENWTGLKWMVGETNNEVCLRICS